MIYIEFDNEEDLIDEEEADNQIMRNMEKLNSLRHVRVIFSCNSFN